MPVKYKLAAWSAALILLLMTGYSLVQFGTVNGWMRDAERSSLQDTADEISAYLADPEAGIQENIPAHQSLLARFVRQNQMLRLTTTAGKTLLVIENGLPAGWIKPVKANGDTVEDFRIGQDHILLIRKPIRTQAFTGTMELAANLESLDVLKDSLVRLMVLYVTAGIAISAIGGLLLAGVLLKPVKRIGETMRAIQRQGIHERARYRNQGDEVGKLYVIFNEMMDELERAFLRQRQFVEDASHEFRTPIAIIEGHLKLLKRWGKENVNVLGESLEAALQETFRLKSLANQLLELTGGGDAELLIEVSPIDPADAVMAHVRNYEILYPERSFTTKLQEGLRIRINPHHLAQLLVIATDNAIRYSGPERPVSISVYRQKKQACIAIKDFGVGIPADQLPYVFERFYRVDKARDRKAGGNGLGLSIAKRLTEAYGGSIRLDSEPGEGTTVHIEFPLA